jgi:hypothetical protein
MAEMAPISAVNLVERRTPNPKFLRPQLTAPAIAERVIAGPKGAPDVRVYVINAGGASVAKPAILHIHGGGFITGDAKYGLTSLQEIALAVDCGIVTVDYRLAPETRFPGALERVAKSGNRFSHETRSKLLKIEHDSTIKRFRLIASCSRRQLRRPEVAFRPRRRAWRRSPAHRGHGGERGRRARRHARHGRARPRRSSDHVSQALVYPMLDDRTGSTRPGPPQVGQILWRPADNRFGWTSLLGVPAGSANTPAGLSQPVSKT